MRLGKRALALFLAMVTCFSLVTPAYAGMGAGDGVSVSGVGGKTKFQKMMNEWGGMVLSVQPVGEVKRNIDKPQEPAEDSLKEIATTFLTTIPSADLGTIRQGDSAVGDGMILLPNHSGQTDRFCYNSQLQHESTTAKVYRMSYEATQDRVNAAAETAVKAWINQSKSAGNKDIGPWTNFWYDYVNSHWHQEEPEKAVVWLYSASESNKGYKSGDATGVLNPKFNKYTAQVDGTAKTGILNAIKSTQPSDSPYLSEEDMDSVVQAVGYYGLLAQVLCCYSTKGHATAVATQLDTSMQALLGGAANAPTYAVAGVTLGCTGDEGNNMPCSSYDIWWDATQILGARGYGSMQVTPADYPIEHVYKGTHGTVPNAVYGEGPTSDFKAWRNLVGGSYELAGTWIHTGGEDVLKYANDSTYKIGLTGYGYWFSWGMLKKMPIPPLPYDREAHGNDIGLKGGVVGCSIEKNQTVEKDKFPADWDATYTVSLNINVLDSSSSQTITHTAQHFDGINPNPVSSTSETTNIGPSLYDFLFALNAFPGISDAEKNAHGPKLTIYYKTYTNCPVDSSMGTAKSNLEGYGGDGNSVELTDAGIKTSTAQQINRYRNGSGAEDISNKVFPFLSSAIIADAGAAGCKVEVDAGQQKLVISFNDIKQALQYFQSHSTISVSVEVPIKTKHNTDTDARSIWVVTGGGARVPVRELSGKTWRIKDVDVGFVGRGFKADYVTVVPKLEIKPSYYSTMQVPHTEFKQGTVHRNAVGSDETFDAMLGSPTSTIWANNAYKTANHRDVQYGGVYSAPTANGGPYYYYFASGGSEFLVQFDAEYMANQTATRSFTFNANLGGIYCSSKNLTVPDCPQPCGGHGSDPTTYSPGDDCACPHTPHCNHGLHYMQGTTTLSYTYTGLHYVKITNLKVWQLTDAYLDGTRALLDVDNVRADILGSAPGASWNIAQSNTSAEGRMVYKWYPDGAGAGGNADHLVFTGSPISGTCGKDGDEMKDWAEGILSGSDRTAWCVSDYIVLHTTRGDQTIFYHEYKSDTSGSYVKKVTGSSGGVAAGVTTASISVEWSEKVGEGKDKDFASIDFSKLTGDAKAIAAGKASFFWTGTQGTSAKGGSSEKARIKPDGITHGGYNGKYSSPDTKYQSFGGPVNNMTWSGTKAYLNESKAFNRGSPNANLYVSAQNNRQIDQSLRLMHDGLVVPDTKTNGFYGLSTVSLFYRNLVNYGPDDPNYSVTRSSLFGANGHVVTPIGYADRSKDYAKDINDVVIYDPVSVVDAIVISLPASRDQRYTKTVNDGNFSGSGKAVCPGDATCPYQTMNCTTTQHLHNKDCYSVQYVEQHSWPELNAHDHTDACKSNGTASGSASYPASGRVTVYTFTASGTETLNFWSSNASNDPRGVLRDTTTGTDLVDNDDGAGNLNFSVTYSSLTAGHTYALQIYAYNSNVGGTCNWTATGVQSRKVIGSGNISYNNNTDYKTVYTYTATGGDTLDFWSTSYTNDPEGRIVDASTGTVIARNDDGGPGGSLCGLPLLAVARGVVGELLERGTQA